MRPVIVIRSPPALEETVAKLRAQGVDAHGEILRELVPLAWNSDPLICCDALLAGSATIFRLGGAELDKLCHLPVLAVGAATANSARERGFAVVQTGTGGLQELLNDPAHADKCLARPAGRERTPIAPGQGQRIVEAAVYEAVERPLSAQAIARLSIELDTPQNRDDGPIVLLYSVAGAQVFRAQCAHHQIDRQTVSIIALSAAVARGAGDGWACVHIADVPTDAAMLAIGNSLSSER